MIKIWQPRWHDRKVLIAQYKVREGINKIKFTKARTLADKVYSLDSTQIRQYPLESNGKIPCYAVPLDTVVKDES